jgi:hypothetical protein
MDVKNVLRTQLDRVLAGACVVLGGIALLFGWIGISGTALSYKQIPYIISGGLLGVILVGIGLTLYLSADLRDEWRKLDDLDQSLREATERLPANEPMDPEFPRERPTARSVRTRRTSDDRESLRSAAL